MKKKNLTLLAGIMVLLTNISIISNLTGLLVTGNVWAQSTSQYNMSLQDKVVTGPNGYLTSPQAAAVNKLGQLDEKRALKIADGIYHLEINLEN